MLDSRLQSGERLVAVAPHDGITVLRLIAPDPQSKLYNLIGRSTHIVFLTEDVLATFKEWRSRGVRFRYTPRLRRIRRGEHLPVRNVPIAGHLENDDAPVWGGVFTHFEDLDGNSFMLAGFDDVSREIEAQRRALRERAETERRTEQELQIAREVQARLFPQKMPSLSTLEYAGICIQAHQVGGDYYDFLNLGQQRFGLVVGDIAGKGIAAALLMANLQANLRSQCIAAVDQPDRMLESVNELFFENTNDSAYATLFFCEYDDAQRRLRYVNCGHLAALLVRADESVERLESTSTVLGLFRQWSGTLAECQLASGDTLALYTDGVTESFDERGEEFGEQRLVETLQKNRRYPPNALLVSILDEVKRFSYGQHDDITLIVARCD